MIEGSKKLHPSKIKMSKKTSYFYLFIGALLTSFASYYFIVNSELFTPGLGGISYGIAYVITDLVDSNWISENINTANVMLFWIFYSIGNIPIIYFMLKWFTRRFLIMSLFFFFVNLMFSMIFSNVPGFKEPLFTLEGEGFETLLIMTSAFFAGLIYGIGTGMAFKAGACTMGLDPVAKHFSREKDISIAPILFTITLSSTTFFTLIRFFTSPPNNDSGFIRNTLFSPEYLGTLVFVAIYSLVTAAIYSSNKKVEITVKTTKTEEISNYFNNSSYHRGHSLIEIEGGYSHKKYKSFQMITNIEEMYDVVQKIASLDSQAFIIVNELKKVYDVHDWRTKTEEEIEKNKQKLIKQENKQNKKNTK